MIVHTTSRDHTHTLTSSHVVDTCIEHDDDELSLDYLCDALLGLSDESSHEVEMIDASLPLHDDCIDASLLSDDRGDEETIVEPSNLILHDDLSLLKHKSESVPSSNVMDFDDSQLDGSSSLGCMNPFDAYISCNDLSFHIPTCASLDHASFVEEALFGVDIGEQQKKMNEAMTKEEDSKKLKGSFIMPTKCVEASDAPMEDSTFLIDDIKHIDESFQQILSCDLPADIVDKGSDCTKPPRVVMALTDESLIDFLGCFRYLEGQTLYLHGFLFNPPTIIIDYIDVLAFGKDIGFISLVQAYRFGGLLSRQIAHYLLGPPPIDLESPPSKMMDRLGRRIIWHDFMFLIKDENFSFKSLKRFKSSGCLFSL